MTLVLGDDPDISRGDTFWWKMEFLPGPSGVARQCVDASASAPAGPALPAQTRDRLYRAAVTSVEKPINVATYQPEPGTVGTGQNDIGEIRSRRRVPGV